MSNSFFRFKQFIVHQGRCGMKVSTDATVLGALVSHKTPGKILDIGTGTGVIALMLAQRFPESLIEGIEIDKDAYVQANENVLLSQWKDRVQLYHQSFQQFAAGQPKGFDLIVSNPPYFHAHIKSRDSGRNLALHNDALPFEELVQGVESLLNQEGVFWVILPERQMQDLEKIASAYGLYPRIQTNVFHQSISRILRVVQAFSFVPGELITQRLNIRDMNQEYSTQYKKLLKDFLLNF